MSAWKHPFNRGVIDKLNNLGWRSVSNMGCSFYYYITCTYETCLKLEWKLTKNPPPPTVAAQNMLKVQCAKLTQRLALHKAHG
ncbi:hypothetical protein CSE16_18665 [Solibacillus sp. R5-41]|nr:hypothetical protein CSE16_18665 [Solibacillus sp. R5-41]